MLSHKNFNKIDVLDSIISYTSFHRKVDFRVPPSVPPSSSFPISPSSPLFLPSSPSLSSYLILPIPSPLLLCYMRWSYVLFLGTYWFSTTYMCSMRWSCVLFLGTYCFLIRLFQMLLLASLLLLVICETSKCMKLLWWFFKSLSPH